MKKTKKNNKKKMSVGNDSGNWGGVSYYFKKRSTIEFWKKMILNKIFNDNFVAYYSSIFLTVTKKKKLLMCFQQNTTLLR